MIISILDNNVPYYLMPIQLALGPAIVMAMYYLIKFLRDKFEV